MRMLEDEGINEKASTSEKTSAVSAARDRMEEMINLLNTTSPQLNNPGQPDASQMQKEKDLIKEKEKEKETGGEDTSYNKDFTHPESSTALRDHIVNLPLDLPSLEYINTLLERGKLVDARLDPATIVCDYVQRCLRSIESMCDALDSGNSTNDDRYSSNISGPNNSISTSTGGRSSKNADRGNNLISAISDRLASSDGTADGNYGDNSNDNAKIADENENENGREAQIRAIKLLVLFMTNLVRRGFVDPQSIYYEAQEICVRYIWVSDVRAFRAFLYGE